MSNREQGESSLSRMDSRDMSHGAASMASTSTGSISSSSPKDTKDHKSSFSSLFQHNKDQHDPRDSTIGAMLAPAVSIAGAHNPFSIGGLKEDGSRIRPTFNRRGSEDSKAKDDGESIASQDTNRSSKKTSKRHRIRSAFGRSLSPWRYHHETAGSSKDKRGSGSFGISRLSCRDSMDVEREKRGSSAGDMESESDGESVKGGITPRNNAFGNVDADSETYSENDGIEGERYVTASGASSKLEKDRKDFEEKGDASKADMEHPSSETETGSQKEDHEDTEGEDSDDYIDFDEQTLDNTLFNAGCVDLHDAWLKEDGNHSHHHGTPDEVKSEDIDSREGYYGPNDFDAAWKGAGPTGHDENDEALRAPNVVIGQANALSPSELGGEGMDMLKTSVEDERRESRSPSIYRPLSLRGRSPSASSREAGSSSTPTSSISKGEEDVKSQESAPSKTPMLTASRPIFERNRCTITLVHGDFETYAKESKRTKRYIVASDGSPESSYAIEWTIGTVLRDGDEMLVVSVMETDAKLDSDSPRYEDKLHRQEHQRIRQSMAVILARRATAVLQRTRLAVRVSCQALHARNSRHMFIDMIDFFEPTMCVVGSRGLNSIKGVLLGSFSNYCVQKSPVPVMVARKRLKLPALPKGKGDVVSNVRAKHMRLDQAMIEKDANVADENPEKEESEKKEEGKGQEGEEKEKAEVEEGGGEKGNEGETTEAEKIKEAANSPKKDALDIDAQEAPPPGQAIDKESTRGRAKFSIDTGEEDGRGRSRSRTSDRKEA